MTETARSDAGAARVRAPWHLWLVALVGLLWNGYGAYDFVMTFSQGQTYMLAMGMTEAQIDHFNAMPAWMLGGWTLGVWGSVAGTFLLFARSRWAVLAFVASLIGIALLLLYNYVLSDGAKIMGDMAFMNWVIAGGGVLFLLYAWRSADRGVLR